MVGQVLRALGLNIAWTGVVLSVACSATAWAQDVPNQNYTESSLKASLKKLKELSFHPGVNDVFLTGLGKEGQITVAYSRYDSTGSHCLYLITIKDNDSGSKGPSWLTVPIGNNEDETIDDAPLDGELVGTSVRFFNGFIGNTMETLLFISSIEDPLEKSGVAKISVQELINTGDNPPYLFKPILEFKTTSRYRNANNALKNELGISMPGS